MTSPLPDSAWMLIELRYDYGALGRAALDGDRDECLFRIERILEMAGAQHFAHVLEAALTFRDLLHRITPYAGAGIGRAYDELGESISAIPLQLPDGGQGGDVQDPRPL